MAENMTNTKATQTNTKAPQTNTEAPQLERLLIPLNPDGGGDAVFLCVNGKNLLVRRGEPVEVPAAFAEVWRNAQAQQAAAVRAQRAAASAD